MAVAFSSATLSSTYADTTGYSFAYSHSGNALCILSDSDYYYSGTPSTPTITYASNSFTNAFFVDNGAWNAIRWAGAYLLNAPASGTITVSYSAQQDYSTLKIISVSGASTTVAPTSNYAVQPANYIGTNQTVSTTVTSQADNLVVGFGALNTDIDFIVSMNGTFSNTPFCYNYLAGASPTTTISNTFFDYDYSGGTAAFVGGFSFSPSSGPTPHAYVGYSGVANQVQTMPGCARGVVANASSGYGDDVAGSGVVDVFFCNDFIGPVLPSGFILMESSGYILQENDSKIYMEQQKWLIQKYLQ